MTAIPKSMQLAYRRRGNVTTVSKIEAALYVPEALIQGQMDDLLAAKRIRFLRFPDAFFQWMKMHAPENIQKWFFGLFGGIPDTIALFPLGDKYMLACAVEIKTTKGKLHGKQKHWRKDTGMVAQISRGSDDNIRIIEAAELLAVKLRECMAGDTYCIHHAGAASHPIAGLYRKSGE
jgi:hypothetical protein